MRFWIVHLLADADPELEQFFAHPVDRMTGPAVAQGRGLRWQLESKSAPQSRMREAGPMQKVRFVGLDVHKESIAIAVADGDGSVAQLHARRASCAYRHIPGPVR